VNAGFMLDLHMRTVPSASSTRNGSTVTKRASNAHLRGASCIYTSTSKGNGIGVDCGLVKSKMVSGLCVCVCMYVCVSPFVVVLVKVHLVLVINYAVCSLCALYW